MHVPSMVDIVFENARTFSAWDDKTVPHSLVEKAWNLARLGPTCANCSPLRMLALESAEARNRLIPALKPGNVEKTRTAPLTLLIGHDLQFYELLPELFPHVDARSWYVGKEDLIQATAFRNGSLQAAYLILALRTIGLDCGPMSGFDEEKVNIEFFSGTSVRVNFIMNVGFGRRSSLMPRLPRLPFSQVASFL